MAYKVGSIKILVFKRIRGSVAIIPADCDKVVELQR
jgi:hypothetical protein